MHLSTPVVVLLFLLAMVGIFVASEQIWSTKSQWKALAKKYRCANSSGVKWVGCRFMMTEILLGKTRIITSFGRSRFSVWTYLVPPASIATGPKGLYLKRRPWNFMHPCLLIPWAQIASIELIDATDLATGMAARTLAFPEQKMRATVPRPMAGAINLIAGKVARVTLANPKMTISIPAKTVEGASRYLEAQKSATPKA